MVCQSPACKPAIEQYKLGVSALINQLTNEQINQLSKIREASLLSSLYFYRMTVDTMLAKYDSTIVTLALEVRQFIMQELKDIEEYPDNSATVIGYGYGSGYTDMICTILLSKKAVKLAFYKGAELPDPDKLLTGTGKMHRYVEIRSASDLRSVALKKLLKEGYKAYQLRKK